MHIGAGTRLGPYEILSAIGAGGMGEVYRAKDTRLDRIVAIKVLPAHVSDDPALRERFEREARTIAALNHPHICTLHDVGHQNGTDFLVLEHLEGQTLTDRLTKGALPLYQALAIAIQIADALDKAHRAGIVHRDLKPGNIMFDEVGCQAARLRSGEDFDARCRERWPVDAANDPTGPDSAGDDSRHLPVHGAGAVGRARGRHADGHLRVWRGAVRSGDWPEGV